jgi:adenosylhomocysteine nucleosidase
VTRIGIVTGMRIEEECLDAALASLPEDRRPLTFCAGASAGRAYSGARALVERGAAALLSIGIAGGLDAALRPGSIVLPDVVLGPGGAARRVSAAWHTAVIQEVARPAIGTLYASAEPACSVAEKAALRAATGALAVDMESAAVAMAAAETDLPFLVLRVIADPADRAIPRAALYGVAPDGRQRPFAVLARVALRPGEIPALIGLARDSKAALRQLRRVASRGPALFTPPLI